MTETAAVLRNARLSPQKARLVADQIRGLPVERALNVLAYSPKKGAKVIRKVLESAIANAECSVRDGISGIEADRLRIEGFPL